MLLVLTKDVLTCATIWMDLKLDAEENKPDMKGETMHDFPWTLEFPMHSKLQRYSIEEHCQRLGISGHLASVLREFWRWAVGENTQQSECD